MTTPSLDAGPQRRVRIVQVSDLHVGSWGRRKVLDQLRGIVRAAKPDYLIVSGDEVNHPSPWAMRRAARIVAELRRPDEGSSPVPVMALAGNHDYKFWGNFGLRRLTGIPFHIYFREQGLRERHAAAALGALPTPRGEFLLAVEPGRARPLAGPPRSRSRPIGGGLQLELTGGDDGGGKGRRGQSPGVFSRNGEVAGDEGLRRRLQDRRRPPPPCPHPLRRDRRDGSNSGKLHGPVQRRHVPAPLRDAGFRLVLHGHKHFAGCSRIDYSRHPQDRRELVVAAAGSAGHPRPDDPRGNQLQIIDLFDDETVQLQSLFFDAEVARRTRPATTWSKISRASAGGDDGGWSGNTGSRWASRSGRSRSPPTAIARSRRPTAVAR